MTARHGFPVLLAIALLSACERHASPEERAINPWIFARPRSVSAPCEQLCDHGRPAALPSCRARCQWLVDGAAELDEEIDEDGDACSDALVAVLGCASAADDEVGLECSALIAEQAEPCGGESLYDISWQACHEHCDDAMLEPQPGYPTWFECQRRCELAQSV